MSMDTMLEIAECLGISLDYMIWGKADDGELPEDLRSLLSYLQNCDEKKRKKAVKIRMGMRRKAMSPCLMPWLICRYSFRKYAVIFTESYFNSPTAG